MKEATVESRIRSILERECCVDEIGIAQTFESVGLDSLDRTELLLHVETEFGLPVISADDQDKLETLGQLVAYVDKRTTQ